MRRDGAAAISSLGAVRHNAVLHCGCPAAVDDGATFDRAVTAKSGIENCQCSVIRNGSAIPEQGVRGANCVSAILYWFRGT